MVDPNQKVAKVPSSKPYKKRKKTKASVEEAIKNAKLLTSAMSVVGMIKVYFKPLFVNEAYMASIRDPKLPCISLTHLSLFLYMLS